MKINFVNNINDFNDLLGDESNELVCYLSSEYVVNEQYIQEIIKIFEQFGIVSAMYTDVLNDVLYRPFSPNKSLSSIKITSPIIVRSNIAEKMISGDYNDYFNRTKYRKMYYHLAKPAFNKV